MNQDLRQRLIVALDFPGQREAEAFLRQMEGQVRHVKVGMELYYAAGPAWVEQLLAQGLRVFLDLKLHDIPNTVGRAAAVLTRLGVQMFNLHATGGLRMMEAAREGMEAALTPGQEPPLLIAVTALTSMDEREWTQEVGMRQGIRDSVVHLSRMAQQAGLDGVVSSAQEVAAVKEMWNNAVTVTPGIRLKQTADDQRRVFTPGDALRMGCDFLVVGRPITRSEEPLQTYLQVLSEMEAAIRDMEGSE